MNHRKALVVAGGAEGGLSKPIWRNYTANRRPR